MKPLFLTAALAITLFALLLPSSTRADSAAANKASGKIVSRTETTIDVLAKGDTKPVRYLLPADLLHDPKALAFIKGLKTGDEVQLTWVPYRAARLTTSVNVISSNAPAATAPSVGTVTGKAVKPGQMIWLEIQDAAGKTERYSPAWKAGGFDKDIIAAITRRNIGDRVEFTSFTDDHARLTTLRVLALSPQAATQPGFEGGAITGRVTAKDKNSITIKPATGQEQRFIPQEISGTKNELDQSILKAIASATVGDQVEGEWFNDGQHRLVCLHAPSQKPATKPDSGG